MCSFLFNGLMQQCLSHFMIAGESRKLWIPLYLQTQTSRLVDSSEEVSQLINDFSCVAFVLSTEGDYPVVWILHVSRLTLTNNLVSHKFGLVL